MQKLLLSFFFIAATVTAQNNLPASFTQQEEQLFPFWLENHPQMLSSSAPPPQPVRTAAEFDESDGVLITWTSYTSILTQIVAAAVTQGNVYIVCTDSNTVKTALNTAGIPLANCHYIVTTYNSIWARDYGPNSIYQNDVDSLSIQDWIYNRPRPKDDTVPSGLARYMGLNIYTTTAAPNDLIHTGGNYMSDGHGTAFSSNLVVNENPTHTSAEIDSIMEKYMGIHRYIKMNTLPNDVIHHIDMHMKLIDEETLMMAQYPNGVADGPQIDSNLAYIQNNFLDCYGRPYKIVRMPSPPDKYGLYPDNSGDYCTYTNALILNKLIILPLYYTQYDTTALRIWHESMPGYTVVGIDCDNASANIISQLGAIHCITHEIGHRDPIWISHAHLLSTSNTTLPYTVTARIETASGVFDAHCFWTTDTTLGYTNGIMTAAAADSFYFDIPAQPSGTNIFYYITANSVSGRTASKPLVAPAGVFDFWILGGAGLQEQNLTTEISILPNPVSDVATVSLLVQKNASVSFSLTDLSGKKMMLPQTYWSNAGRNSFVLNTASLPSGIYFLKISGDDFSEVRKVVVNH